MVAHPYTRIARRPPPVNNAVAGPATSSISFSLSLSSTGHPLHSNLGRRVDLFWLHPSLGTLNELKGDTKLVLGIEIGEMPVTVQAEAGAILNYVITRRLCFLDCFLHVVDKQTKVMDSVSLFQDEIAMNRASAPVLD